MPPVPSAGNAGHPVVTRARPPRWSPDTGALDARAVDAEPVLPAVGPSSQLWMALVLGKGPAIQPSLGARSSGYSF